MAGFSTRGFVSALVALLAAEAAPGEAADLTIEVTGLRNGDGLLRLALFDDAREFPEGAALRREDVPAAHERMLVNLPDLPPGTYAVALFHDENGDNEFATSFLGIPREGYGFSNDASAFLSAPGFHESAFELPDGGGRIQITVRYW
jgi:uncharacterized protein (DUF2141 family)